jgi:hypothetical protein
MPPEPVDDHAHREHLADIDAALYLVNRLTQDYDEPARHFAGLTMPVSPPAREPDLCDWEHGVCLCPGCGAVVTVRPRLGQAAKVIDLDKREHHCSRIIAGTLHQHGVKGMGGQIARHADRPILDAPRPSAPPATPPQQNGHVQRDGKKGSHL